MNTIWFLIISLDLKAKELRKNYCLQGKDKGTNNLNTK